MSLKASILVFLFAASVGALVVTTPNTIPLRRRSAPRIKDDAWRKKNRDFVNYKFYKASTPSKRAVSAEVPLVDANADNAYYASLSIGTPPVSYNVILDTGSSDLWLASAQPTGSGNFGGGQGLAQLYSSSGSSTFNSAGSQSFSIQYLGGDVSGNTARETVSVGGITVANQTFGVVNSPGSSTIPSQTTGLMGLAFQAIATLGSPWWQNSAESSGWAQPLFAFQLAREENAANAGTSDLPGGSFTIGETDSSLFKGNIEYTNIPTGLQSWWLLQLAEVTVNGVSFPLNGALAAIDTGTTLIGAPQDATNAFYASIPGSSAGQGSSQGYYFYPCSTALNVTFSFGGTSWPVDPQDFTSATNDPSTCMGAIFAAESGSGQPTVSNGQQSISPAWVIGDAFLKNVYSVFRYDPPSVGFATLASSSNPGVTNVAGSETISVETVHGMTITKTYSSYPTAGSYSGAPGLLGRLPRVSLLVVVATTALAVLAL